MVVQSPAPDTSVAVAPAVTAAPPGPAWVCPAVLAATAAMVGPVATVVPVARGMAAGPQMRSVVPVGQAARVPAVLAGMVALAVRRTAPGLEKRSVVLAGQARVEAMGAPVAMRPAPGPGTPLAGPVALPVPAARVVPAVALQ